MLKWKKQSCALWVSLRLKNTVIVLQSSGDLHVLTGSEPSAYSGCQQLKLHRVFERLQQAKAGWICIYVNTFIWCAYLFRRVCADISKELLSIWSSQALSHDPQVLWASLVHAQTKENKISHSAVIPPSSSFVSLIYFPAVLKQAMFLRSPLVNWVVRFPYLLISKSKFNVWFAH